MTASPTPPGLAALPSPVPVPVPVPVSATPPATALANAPAPADAPANATVTANPPPLRRIRVDRYVTPLREGGSLPAIVEADDLGLYVLKFRGAGQGPKALIAEVIGGGIARALGLPVPEIVVADLDPILARTEPDPEIQDLIRASAGSNAALDYLPGSANFDPVADRVDADLASRIVWFDALVSNVDRTVRNTNLLTWHRRLWLIDHGAALYFHHADGDWRPLAAAPFGRIADHVLLPLADRVRAVDAGLAARLTPAVLEAIVAEVPDDWLVDPAGSDDPAPCRAAYVDYLVARVAAREAFVAAIEAARAAVASPDPAAPGTPGAGPAASRLRGRR